ncbi:MAG: hypothetical protein MRY78_16635, partial [Saprospiraceae bacterium]|nr:hypothetical protein [Saprospiraceae bacterium]
DQYQSTAMKDDGAHKDGEAGDYTYGVVIEPTAGKDVINYYIVAENVKAVGFSPSNYMYEQHTSSLKALNQ